MKYKVMPRKRELFVTIWVMIAVLTGFKWSWGLSIESYVEEDDGITCICNTGVMKVTICREDIVRIAYSPTSTIPERPLKIVTAEWETPQFGTSEEGDMIILATGRIKVKVSKPTANITYTDLADDVILSEYAKSANRATVEGVSTYTLHGEFNSPADEGLYGLGQHLEGKMNYKGQTEVLDQDWDSRATAVPILVSSNGYGIFWDSYAKINFRGNIAGNTRYSLTSECGDALNYYFFYGPEIDQVISGYRAATGKVPLFPKWAYGLIQSKDRYLSQREYLAAKDGYRDNNIPVDCIVQDWHYWDGSGAQGCYCFNRNWSDVKGMIDECHKDNVTCMVSIWSQLEQGSPPFNTFSSNGWLWPSDGTTHFIDPYNTDAREAFWNLIRDAFFDPDVQGWDGWWLDNDEPFPYPDEFNRRTLTTARGKGVLLYNTYSFPMSEMGYKNWRRDIPNKRFVLLHRANFAGQQAHSAMQWNNDINCDFSTMANCLPSGLNSTLTGIPYWCTDIGGYWGHDLDWSTRGNRELFTRWFQYGAFQPVFRIHGGGSRELHSSNWDAATKANLLMIDKLHYRLMPYIYSLAWMTTSKDYTPMRHLIFDFRNDPEVKNIGNQYMFGPAFMVSPVASAGATSRSVYLPEGTWYDFWTGKTVTTGRFTAPAPLSRLPLHIRAGSIIPMGPNIQYATERADTIELRVYPGADGSFTMYEDEGDSYHYEKGTYATIPITYIDNPQNLIIGEREGSFPGMEEQKVFNVVFVSEGIGSGGGTTAQPDHRLIYTGDPVSTNPVGIRPGRLSGMLQHYKATIRTVGDRITLPGGFSGKRKTVAVYNSSGRLLRNVVFNKDVLDVRKDMGLTTGLYFIKAEASVK